MTRYQNQQQNLNLNPQNQNLNLNLNPQNQNQNRNINLEQVTSQSMTSQSSPDPVTSTTNSGQRDVNNTPSWMKNKDSSPKKQRLFIYKGSILNITPSQYLRKMPLALDNNLPSTILRFGSSDERSSLFLSS